MKTKFKLSKQVSLFLFGQAVSLFGSSLIQFAIIWYVTRVTDSGLMIAISTLVSFLPQVLSSLYGGVIADRYNRKFVIILADGTIAISTLILAIVMSLGYEGLGLILVISAIRSFGSGIQSPAVSAMIPQLVNEDELMKVNSLYSSLTSLIYLAAPAAAGWLLSVGQFYHLLYIDLITAIIGIGLLLLIPVKAHERSTDVNASIREDIMEGIRYTRNSFFLKKIMNFYVLVSIAMVPAAFLNVLLVTRYFGDDYLLLTLNEISFFIGASLGGILIAQWGGFKNRIHTVFFGMILFGVTTVLIGFTAELAWFIPYLLVMVLCGMSMPAFNTPIYVLLQEKVSVDHQGRVFSLLQMVNSVVMPLSMMVFGPMGDYIPLSWMMLASGFFQILIVVIMLRDHAFIDEGKPKTTNIETAEPLEVQEA